MGSGNLGRCAAITAGGTGAVFCMWVAAFIGTATAFAECSLATVIKNVMPMGSCGGRHGIWRAGWGRAGWASVRRLLLIAYGIIFSRFRRTPLREP
ncbi:alanine:cation symporter family protein [Escherichia coli]